MQIGGGTVPPGTQQRLEIPVSRLPTGTWLSLPVAVLHGAVAGPRLWLSAAVHGDELNGVEIIRQVLQRIDARKLTGSLIAVPIVNVYGFIEQSRYLPDHRDLNRSFPGSPRGSLAARLANLFMVEIVGHCTHGIDLHTASHHRINLPQLRANLDDADTRRFADAFGAPVMIHSQLRDGSLRQAANQQGIAVLVYEAGEAQRFNPEAVAAGVAGVLRVMAHLGMIAKPRKLRRGDTFVSRETSWLRARHGGILRLHVGLGAKVLKGQPLGFICDAFGDEADPVVAHVDGLIIGMNNNPLVSQGDAILHIAQPQA